MGRVTRHRKSMLLAQRTGRTLILYCYSSSYMNWPRRTPGKSDSHRITGQETYTHLYNPSSIQFYWIISDIASLEPLLQVSFFHQNSGSLTGFLRTHSCFRIFKAVQNQFALTQLVYFFFLCSSSVITFKLCNHFNRADIQSLFHRSPLNLPQEDTVCLSVTRTV